MESFNWALDAYKKGTAFAAFDVETTGLEPRLDQIVEIGAVKFDRNGLIARFSTLINPGIPMPAGAERVNKISDEMLKGKPPLDEVFPDFVYFIRGAVLAAHNTAFDCGFINEKLKERWERSKPWVPPFPSLPNPIADTLVISREVFPGRRSYSLQNLAADFNIPALDAHRAEDDARLCMEIFIRCLGAVTNRIFKPA